MTAPESEEASDFWERIDGAEPRDGEGMPPGMVFAVVCGVLLAGFWGFGALVTFWFRGAFGDLTMAWGAVFFLLAVAGAIGVLGCARRWVWVRWAALAQAIAVSVTLFGLMGVAPFVPWAAGLFIAYAGLQFLPSSHRWYHPRPLRKQVANK
ncbi:hypothetical protein [Microbacterium galbinum]|uniref:hypothetical protein n=1 Tax=Microbacterium galbinum TaxID=2851646 RepID=UPI001FFCF9D1|nr:hypothetical protein [Microbacterium galbinum]MCK2030595.1 hypothetical protein [Microbacterium galbinum]